METSIPETLGLLAQAQAGDLEAFGGVCRNYEKRLFRQAISLCGNEALAEDLAQDTFVEAWKSLRRYNGRCQFYTWLCAILLNRYRNTLREKRPVPFTTLTGKDANDIQRSLDHGINHEPLPDQSASLREEAALVQRCIQALPPKHQQVIQLRFYVDDSLEGIAVALGCSVGTVKSRLFHALEKLRAMPAMSEHGRRVESKILTL